MERENMFEVKSKIISEIRLHPVIYDKAHRNHFKKNIKDPIYDGIANLINQEFNLNVNGNICKFKNSALYY